MFSVLPFDCDRRPIVSDRVQEFNTAKCGVITEVFVSSNKIVGLAVVFDGSDKESLIEVSRVGRIVSRRPRPIAWNDAI